MQCAESLSDPRTNPMVLQTLAPEKTVVDATAGTVESTSHVHARPGGTKSPFLHHNTLGKDSSSPEPVRNIRFFPSSVSGKTYTFEYSKFGPVVLNKHPRNRSHRAKAFAKAAPNTVRMG